MEMIMISERKLKIMLTADDMEKFSISNELMAYEKRDAREMFRPILEEAEEKCGFESAAGKLFIQVYPSKNGGCEVYVTKPEESPSNEKNEKEDKRKREKAPARRKKEYCAYVFENLNDGINACRILRDRGYNGESSFWYEQSSGGQTKYYLTLQEEIPQNQTQRRRKSATASDIAGEFGRRAGGAEVMAYIKEHATAVAKADALDAIGGLG